MIINKTGDEIAKKELNCIYDIYKGSERYLAMGSKAPLL